MLTRLFLLLNQRGGNTATSQEPGPAGDWSRTPQGCGTHGHRTRQWSSPAQPLPVTSGWQLEISHHGSICTMKYCKCHRPAKLLICTYGQLRDTASPSSASSLASSWGPPPPCSSQGPFLEGRSAMGWGHSQSHPGICSSFPPTVMNLFLTGKLLFVVVVVFGFFAF